MSRYSFFKMLQNPPGLKLAAEQMKCYTEFAACLDRAGYWALEGRFLPQTKRPRPPGIKSGDLKKLLKVETPPSMSPPDPLHVVKAFKILEQDLLHQRTDGGDDSMDTLSLGELKEGLKRGRGSLARLLISIPNASERDQ